MKLCASCGYSLRDEASFCGACGSPITVGATATATVSQPVANAESSSALSDAIAHVKAGEMRQAISDLLRWWQALRWEIRLAVVTTCVVVLLVILYASGSALLSLLLIPFCPALILTLARPEPMLGKVDRFIQWCALKRDQSKAKGSFLATWFFRPLYAGLSGSATLTAPVKDPYLRAGLTLGLQIFALFLALFVAYAVVMLVIALLFIALMFWIVSFILSEEKSAPNVGRWVTRGRSETQQDILGNEYAQRYDDQGYKVGYSEKCTDMFGNEYQQHFSQEGKKTGHSEAKTDLLGQPYTQHYDQQGARAGSSEDQTDLLGDPYVQHYDEQGRRAGRSEERTNILGDKYVKHEEE